MAVECSRNHKNRAVRVCTECAILLGASGVLSKACDMVTLCVFFVLFCSVLIFIYLKRRSFLLCFIVVFCLFVCCVFVLFCLFRRATRCWSVRVQFVHRLHHGK